MPPDARALRAVLKQYVGPAYDRALRKTGNESSAREATRRAMELLKRAYEEGVEPTKALVLRITDDCCDENAFYNRQPEGTLPGRQQPRAGYAQAPGGQAPAQGPPGLKMGAAAELFPALERAAASQRPQAPEGSLPPLPSFHGSQPWAGGPPSPFPAGESLGGGASAGRSRRGAAADFPSADPGFFPGPFAGEERKKGKRPKGKATPGSALLVMFLSLVVVVLVVLLVVTLFSSGSLPELDWGFASDFSGWFNAHIFPLY